MITLTVINLMILIHETFGTDLNESLYHVRQGNRSSSFHLSGNYAINCQRKCKPFDTSVLVLQADVG